MSWAGETIWAEIKDGLQKIPFEFSQGLEFKNLGILIFSNKI
jgi:hypothetical protein